MSRSAPCTGEAACSLLYTTFATLHHMSMSQSNTFTGFQLPGLSCNNLTNTSPNPASLVALMSHNPYGCHDEVLWLPRRISNGQRRRPTGSGCDPRSYTAVKNSVTESRICSATSLTRVVNFCAEGHPSYDNLTDRPVRTATAVHDKEMSRGQSGFLLYRLLKNWSAHVT